MQMLDRLRTMTSFDLLFERQIANIGPAWQRIARILHVSISEIYPNYELVQIKSKLGAMRYYIDYSSIHDDEISKTIMKLIGAAESATFTTCSNCGGHKDPKSKNGVLHSNFNDRCNDCS